MLTPYLAVGEAILDRWEVQVPGQTSRSWLDGGWGPLAIAPTRLLYVDYQTGEVVEADRFDVVKVPVLPNSHLGRGWRILVVSVPAEGWTFVVPKEAAKAVQRWVQKRPAPPAEYRRLDPHRRVVPVTVLSGAELRSPCTVTGLGPSWPQRPGEVTSSRPGLTVWTPAKRGDSVSIAWADINRFAVVPGGDGQVVDIECEWVPQVSQIVIATDAAQWADRLRANGIDEGPIAAV